MSNSLAIAAVTATVRNLLDKGITALTDLSDTKITTLAPDKARATLTANQLNIFLYQASINAGLRNAGTPGAEPPLALNLSYLLTAWGRGDDEVFAQRVMGRAMSILHDHPLLGADEIKAALPPSDLGDQPERVRISPQPLSLEELSKLWTTFQTNYRLSTAYQASVVLIESSRPARAPLPVLAPVVAVQPDLVPPYPTLTGATPPFVRLGETLTLTGHHLEGDTVQLKFLNRNLSATAPLPAMAPSTSTEVRAGIPNDAANWPAGYYSVSAIISHAGQDDSLTNDLPFALAPAIVSVVPPNPVRDGNGDVTLAVSCSPEVRPNQRASLLLGGREIVAESHALPTGTLTFVVRAAPAGQSFIRLRVDGVDSILVDESGPTPVFDPTQRITIA